MSFILVQRVPFIIIIQFVSLVVLYSVCDWDWAVSVK